MSLTISACANAFVRTYLYSVQAKECMGLQLFNKALGPQNHNSDMLMMQVFQICFFDLFLLFLFPFPSWMIDAGDR